MGCSSDMLIWGKHFSVTDEKQKSAITVEEEESGFGVKRAELELDLLFDTSKTWKIFQKKVALK